MKVAFAFAGQGAEEPRMGIEMAEAHEPARALIAAAGGPIMTKLARGRPISCTSELQPALVAVSLGAASALAEHGVRPDVVLGHSLGELSAWSASGAIAPVHAVQLAAARGGAMERQADLCPGGMLALSRCDLAGVARALEAGASYGELSIAAQNAANAWVLSGDEPALSAAARSVLPPVETARLRVGGPWHARSMAGAIGPFESALAGLEIRRAHTPMITNATGVVGRPERVSALLCRQLARPVRWVRSMQSLAHLAVTDLITPGPAKVLRHLVRQTLPELRLHACETPADVERLARELGPSR